MPRKYRRQRTVPKRLVAIRDKIIGDYGRGNGLNAIDLSVKYEADVNDIRQLLREANVWVRRPLDIVIAHAREKKKRESVERECLCCRKMFEAEHKGLYICSPCKASSVFGVQADYTTAIG